MLLVVKPDRSPTLLGFAARKRGRHLFCERVTVAEAGVPSGWHAATLHRKNHPPRSVRVLSGALTEGLYRELTFDLEEA